MNVNDLNYFESDGLPFNISFVADDNNIIAEIDNENGEKDVYHVITVTGYSSSINNENDVEVLDAEENLMALLCFSCEGKAFEVSGLTAARFISYLVDIDNYSASIADRFYTFRKSYLLVLEDFIDEYNIKYKNLSPHWGKFTHENYEKVIVEFPDQLVAKSHMVMPTKEHVEKFQRSIISADGFDRFLKKYHVLELIYDYVCILRLRTINTDLIGFSKIMNDYSGSGEIDNLNNVISTYVEDVDEIVSAFQESKDFPVIVRRIFQDKTRASNPLGIDAKWSAFWEFIENQDVAFSEDKIARGAPRIIKYTSREEYNKFLLKISAYWIYRIRCSIAHMKIGEFIFKQSDEGFVVTIGERMLDSMIDNIYSNSEFISLIRKSDKLSKLLEQVSVG
jgi:hypothetical protein